MLARRQAILTAGFRDFRKFFQKDAEIFVQIRPQSLPSSNHPTNPRKTVNHRLQSAFAVGSNFAWSVSYICKTHGESPCGVLYL
jgi:hypothetical protein